MTKKEIIKNLIFVGFIASLIFIIQIILFKEPYVGYGDYFHQQIAFYKHAHAFIRDGNWLWDWTAELGTEFIPTYSFYLTFSPFFLITLLFPNEWIIYEMPILIVLKIVLSNATALLFFKDKFKKKELVFLAAFLYAFCGWMFDSLFFNHFIEVMAIFPLYLWSFDKVMSGEKKGLFAILTAASLLINYFFWFGEVIFIAIYFVIRKIFDKEYVVQTKGFIRFIIEGLLGVGITCLFLFPITHTVFQNPRANEKLLVNVFTFENIQMYFQIIENALVFPKSIISQTGWFSTLKYGVPSQTLYTPVIGMFLVPVFFVKSSKKWLKVFLGMMSIISFVPILNSVFALFSEEYYARWFYMFTFFIIWASLSVLDEIDIKTIKKISAFSIFIIMLLYIVVCIAGYKLHIISAEQIYPDNILFSVGTFIISVLIFVIFVWQKNIKRMTIIAVLLASTSVLWFYSWTCYQREHLEGHEYISFEWLTKTMTEIEDNTGDFYRIYNDRYLNTGLVHNKSSILGYNSIVPSSIYDFYSLLNKDRDVKSVGIYKESPLLNLFSTKYIYNIDKWEINNDYLPMGVIFKNIQGVDNYDEFIVSETDIANKLYLEDIDYQKYKHLYNKDDKVKKEYTISINKMEILVQEYEKRIEYSYYSTNGAVIPNVCTNFSKITFNDGNIMSSPYAGCDKNNLYINYSGEVKIVVDKMIGYNIESANLTNMEFTQYGFSADSNLDSENLVFFTIPYTDLWEAYIDGEQVDIIKGDNAFIVLYIPKGEHHIEILYDTKYYEYGAIASGISLVIFVAYMLINKKQKSDD